MEDDFAQSRGAHDLFMDEFETPDNPETYVQPEPIIQQVQATQQEDGPARLSAENVERHTQAHYDQQAYQHQNQNQSAGQNGARGGRRGRGRGGNGNGHGAQRGNYNERRVPGEQGGFNPAAPIPAQPTAAALPVMPTKEEEKITPLERVDDTIASIAAPTGPATQHRVQAVRGDRSATGPAKPKKRTEAEITELMAKMKLKSSAAAEAHERTRKDQAAFEQREREARREREEKVIKERQNVRAMDSERAKNAIRKQKAMQGREWDSEKQESDIVDKSRGNSSRYMKSANGGVARDVQPSRETSSRMEEAARAVRSVEEDFPALGAGMSGARGAAGRGGGMGAKQGSRADLFPSGPAVGRGGRGEAQRGQSSRGGGLGSSRYDDVADDKNVESKRSANTDIRLEEKVEAEKKDEVKQADLEAGKKELEELKNADQGNAKSWAEEANEAAPAQSW